MHETLEELQAQLKKVIAQVKASIPAGQVFGIAHSNWSFPGLTSEELSAEAQSLIDFIDDYGVDDLGDAESVLAGC